MKKPVWITLGVLAVPLLALAVFVASRERWIEPVPGVDLTPARPLLRPEDVTEDSAFGLLVQATSYPDALEKSLPFREDPAAKLRARGWPNPLPEAIAPSDPAPETESGGRSTAEEIEAAYDAMQMGETQDRERPFNPDEPWSREEVDQILETLDAAAPYLTLARRAAEQPEAQVPTITDFETPLHYLQKTRHLARLFALRATYRAQTGDVDGALDDISTCMRMGQILTRGGLLINRLVAVAVNQIALLTLWELSVDDPLTLEQAVRMAAFAATMERELEPLPEVFRYEALATTSMIDAIFTGRASSLGMGPSSGATMRTALPVAGLLIGSSRASVTRNLQYCYQHMIAMSENPRDQAAADAFFDRFSTGGSPTAILRKKDPVGFIMASMLLPSLRSVMDKHLSELAALRLTRTYLALQAYVAANGSPPESLQALVQGANPAPPMSFPDVLRDPFDGAPLRYKRADSAWIVYSVGTNGNDDGGDGDGFMLHAEPLDGDEDRQSMRPSRRGRRYLDEVVAGQRRPHPLQPKPAESPRMRTPTP